jgi:hypothetical protein
MPVPARRIASVGFRGVPGRVLTRVRSVYVSGVGNSWALRMDRGGGKGSGSRRLRFMWTSGRGAVVSPR